MLATMKAKNIVAKSVSGILAVGLPDGSYHQSIQAAALTISGEIKKAHSYRLIVSCGKIHTITSA